MKLCNDDALELGFVIPRRRLHEHIEEDLAYHAFSETECKIARGSDFRISPWGMIWDALQDEEAKT